MTVKVVHLTSVHSPFDTRIFQKECKSLASAGYEVVLVVPHDQDETVDGIRIRAVPKPANRLQRMIFTVGHVYQAARDEQADLYHFHDPELIPIGLLLQRQGARIIYDIHEDYVTSIAQKSYLPLFFRRFFAKWWDGIEVSLSKRFGVVLAERYYLERFPAGIIVLNYPRNESFVGSPCCVPASPPRLLYTGGISEDRGALIHAQLVQLVDNVEVHMVGCCSISLREKMLEVAGTGRERLHLETSETHVPYQRILSYYQQGGWLAGLALFPPTPHYMRKENTKFFEYMGAGIPVLCSDFPDWRSLIAGSGCGICVNPYDQVEIIRTIESLVVDPVSAMHMGQRGRGAVETQYNWESESQKLLHFYERLLS